MRWWALAGSWVVLGAGTLPGCSLFVQAEDGESCTESRDCRSGTCNQGTCAGSDCSEGDDVCREGWICTHHSPDIISGFFGADGSDRCTATCGSCPANTYCAEGGTRGVTPCTYGEAPLQIELADVTAVVGRPVTLVAVAHDGARLAECTWSLGDGSSQQTRSAVLEHTFAQAQTSLIAVDCVDDDGRMGSASATLTVSPQ